VPGKELLFVGYLLLIPNIVVKIPVKKETAINPTKTRAVWVFSLSNLYSPAEIAEVEGIASCGLTSLAGFLPA
jgi:hypothetical protein